MLVSGRETVTYKVSWEEPKLVKSFAQNTTFCKAIAYYWRFNPSVNGCLAEMEMNLDFHSPTTAVLFDAFSDSIKARIVDAFVERIKASERAMHNAETPSRSLSQ